MSLTLLPREPSNLSASCPTVLSTRPPSPPAPSGQAPCCWLQEFCRGHSPCSTRCLWGLQAVLHLEEQAGTKPTLLPPVSPLCQGHPFPSQGTHFLLGCPCGCRKEQGSLGTQAPQVCIALRMGSGGHLSELIKLLNELRFPKHLEQCGTGVSAISMFAK